MITAVRVLLGLAIAYAAGFSLVRLLWRATRGDRSLGLRSAVALIVGIGLSSLTTVAYRAAGGALDARFIAVDALFLSAVAVVLWRSAGALNGGALTHTTPRSRRPSAETLVAAGLVALAVVATTSLLVQSTRASPSGGWDAWAIWNLRGRFLFRSPGDWRIAFDPAMSWSNLDYPLLVPGSVARLWAYAGRDTTGVPALLASIFALSGIGLLGGALWPLRGPATAATGVLLLVATFGWHSEGRAQYADVPLACYLLAALAVLASVDDEAPRRRLGIAGLLLALSAWTKNEGWAFLVVVMGVWSMFQLRSRQLSATKRSVVAFAIGAAPVAAAVLTVRHATEATNGLARQDAGAVLAKLVDWERYTSIARAFAASWPGRGAVSLVLLASVVLLGARIRSLLSSWAVAAVATIVATYFVVFLTTPYDLTWHLGTAANRVLLQVWPSVLFAVLLATNYRAQPERAPSAE